MASLLGAIAETGPAALAAGTIIADQYRIERAVGEGGMGVVYLARDIKLDRDVAVKVCTGLSTSAVHRIQREAMALAKLAHPNVVVIFQAGEIDHRFFIAMEYVAGGTAADWATATERRPAEIVMLYAAAGDGLAAAHEAGLVHRDFKPDNVLVGADGRPRVADFGLVRGALASDAEARDSEAEAREGVTLMGAVMGTPAYMPPEQLAGEALDARADQYAFAASLWEALFGVRPTAVATTSAVVKGSSLVPVPPQNGRRPVPRHVVNALQRALAHDREQRWPDMSALLAELRRDPNAQRRRFVAIGGALVLTGGIALAASMGSSDELPPPCTDAASRMAEIWNDERAAALARTLGEPASHAIAQRVEEHASEWVIQHAAACRATRVDGSASDTVLDRRMLCLEGRKREIQAILSVLERGTPEAIANAPAAIDLLPASAACLDTSALGTDVLPTDPALREQIASAQEAVAAAGAASLDPSALDALAEADRGVELARTARWRPILAQALATRGSVLYELLRPRDAMVAYEEAIHVALAAGSDELAAQALADGAWALADLARPAEARQALATARALWERTGSSPELGQRVLGAVAHVALVDHRPQDALVATTEQIVLATEAFGAESTSVATNEYNLAIALHAAHRPTEAAAAIDRAIELARATLGDDHPTVARYLGLAGRNAGSAGDLAKASALAGRALELQERWFGADDPRHIGPLQVLGDVARRRGEHAEATALGTRALELQRRRDPGSPAVAETEANLAMVAVEQGDFVAAGPRASAALAALERAHGVEAPQLVNALLLTGYIARERPDRDLDASLRDLERAHALAVTHLGADSSDAVNLEIEIGNTLVAKGDARQAVEMLEARLATLDGLELPLHAPLELRLVLARALEASGDRSRACLLAAEAEAELQRLDIPPMLEAAASWRSAHCARSSPRARRSG